MIEPPFINIDGYPPIHRIKFMQGSGTKPGRCIVDAGNDEDLKIRNLSRDVVLEVKHQESGFIGKWNNMRVVKAPRARNGHVRVVLEDDRWHLTQHTMHKNYNERDALGNVLTDTKKTIEELLDEISKAADDKIKFSVGKLPKFEPPARWSGKLCSQAFSDLLYYTGCRAVYSPETEEYVVGLPDGELPKTPDQIFQPAPPLQIRDIYFHSYPILHETELEVDAVTIDEDTGEAVNVSSGDVLGGNPLDPMAQMRYRLWKCSDDKKVVTEFRPKAHIYDPKNQYRQRGRIIRDEYPRFPVHQPFVLPGTNIVRSIDDTSGGKVFVTEHPVLTADGNNYATTAKMVTGYFEKDDDDELKRSTIKKSVNPEATSDAHVYINWIKPVDSDQSDVGDSAWDGLFKEVVEAMFSKYLGPPSSVSNPYPMKLDGLPNVGEVEYDFRLADINSRHNFRVAFNFGPGSEGEIR